MRQMLKETLLSGVFGLAVLLTIVFVPTGSVHAEIVEKEAVLCGKNGAVESMKNASTVSLNSVYKLNFHSIVSKYDDKGGAQYEGTLANTFRFSTSNKNSFYQLYFSNSEFIIPVTFKLCDSSGIECTYTKSSTTLSQSTGDYVTYKLKPNNIYYVTISAPNGEDYTPSTVSATLKEIVDDAGDDNTTATFVESNVGYEFNLDGYNDVDFFSFNTDSSKSFYSITYSGKDLKQSTLEVYTTSLEKIATLDVNANVEKTEELDLGKDKRYYVKVSSSNEFTTGSYYFRIGKVKDDIKDDPSAATKIYADKSYT